MEFVPLYFGLTVVGILGLIIGSFLDVVVCRFHTGKSINGRSRCMSCGHTLSWYELFPLVSYALLRGRCAQCEAHIPKRLLLMELLTAGAFMFVYAYMPSFVLGAFSLVLVSLLIVVVAYDIQHMVIPHEFVFAVFACAIVYLGYEFYVTASFPLLLTHALAAIGSSLFYAALWFISKGKWIGLGDAKLAFPLGLMLSVSGAFSFVVLSFWIGAGISLLLLGFQKTLQSGKKHLPIFTAPLTMKSEVPFAPFMIAAFVIVFLAHADVLSFFSFFI